jgi:hypothetical protein
MWRSQLKKGTTMTRRPRAIAGMLAILLMVGAAACGGDDSGKAKADASDKSDQTDQKTDNKTDSSKSGKKDLAAFMNGFCGAFVGFQDSLNGVDSAVSDAQGSAAGPDAAIKLVVDGFSGIADGADQAVKDLKKLDPPDKVTKDARDEFIVALTGAKKSAEDITAKAKKLDPTAPDLPAQIKALSTEFSDSLDAVDVDEAKLDALSDSFSESKKCDALS